MAKVKITVTGSHCRAGYLKKGDTYIIEDLCPPICHQLWSYLYPSVFALLNGATMEHAGVRSTEFDVRCPDEGRVEIHGELIEE